MTTPTTVQRLAAEGIADYAQDLRQLSAKELRALFAFASSGKINAARVIKNLIWQAYTDLREGTCDKTSFRVSSAVSFAVYALRTGNTCRK